MSDFAFSFNGSICTVEAVSDAAIAFAEENFAVEGWQGIPQNFVTDWRAAQNLCEALEADGWEIA